jgi:hypothetical protein
MTNDMEECAESRRRVTLQRDLCVRAPSGTLKRAYKRVVDIVRGETKKREDR